LCSAGTGRRGGVLPRGDNSAGDRQKGEVNLLTRTSQVVRRSLGGFVSLGDERSNGMSFHRGAGSGDVGPSLDGEAGLSLVRYGGSLASL